MKRLIGTFLVAGLISGGGIFVTASPSSAMQRNPCMDEQNYTAQRQWLEGVAYDFLFALAAWENADHYVDPITGHEYWGADAFPNTHGWEWVDSLADYNFKVSQSRFRSEQAQYNLAIFDNTESIC